MSASMAGLCPNKLSREARLGNRTLSSLAFPINDNGSSCSFNILNRADNLGINRLVRKLSEEGSAAERSKLGAGSGLASFLDFEMSVGESSTLSGSLAFLFLRNRFIMGAVGVGWGRIRKVGVERGVWTSPG